MRGYVIQEKGRADWRDVLVPELGPYDASSASPRSRRVPRTST
jgi:hypothetical protein